MFIFCVYFLLLFFSFFFISTNVPTAEVWLASSEILCLNYICCFFSHDTQRNFHPFQFSFSFLLFVDLSSSSDREFIIFFLLAKDIIKSNANLGKISGMAKFFLNISCYSGQFLLTFIGSLFGERIVWLSHYMCVM